MAAWDGFMDWAWRAAEASPDPDTKNGAILVSPLGDVVLAACNRFPRGVEETAARWERPAKYQFVEHAERNAIYQAAHNGLKTAGLTMVCPWAACAECARAIIQAGIVRLVREPLPVSSWSESIALGDQLFSEAGVEVVTL